MNNIQELQKILSRYEFIMNMNHNGLALVSPCGTMAMQAGKNCPYIVFDAVGIQREKVEVVKRNIIVKPSIYLLDFTSNIFMVDSNKRAWFFGNKSRIGYCYFEPETPIYEVVRAKTEPGKPVY